MNVTNPIAPAPIVDRESRVKIKRLKTRAESAFGLPFSRQIASADLICLSHLRWDFVFQRPQHLLSRCAHSRRVFFFEEPVFVGEEPARLEMRPRGENLWVMVPHLPEARRADAEAAQRELLDRMIADHHIDDYFLWYYTPMALGFCRHLQPLGIVYDCMDELSHFKFAPPQLREREAELFRIADVVFTGGQSLYQAKRSQHANVHPFPSSVDVSHFRVARQPQEEPADQKGIAGPRIGFFGVLDERFDITLLRGAAELRPDWQFVMIGPVVKIEPASLPQLPNIHYLGGKGYTELPRYIAGWDVATLLFARNDATRFISPTKTPEYLAAGKPVVSTSIQDVIEPYGTTGLVQIADTPGELVRAVERALSGEDRAGWLERVDRFLSRLSWDHTWAEMHRLMQVGARPKQRALSPEIV